MNWSVLAWALASGMALAAAGAQPIATRQPGAVLFENRCARCHGVKGDGDSGLAPLLRGVVGRPAASVPGYLYSNALKKHSAAWTPALLDPYLTDPQAFAPGAEMDVVSPDPTERTAIIEYLRTLR